MPSKVVRKRADLDRLFSFIYFFLSILNYLAAVRSQEFVQKEGLTKNLWLKFSLSISKQQFTTCVVVVGVVLSSWKAGDLYDMQKCPTGPNSFILTLYFAKKKVH